MKRIARILINVALTIVVCFMAYELYRVTAVALMPDAYAGEASLAELDRRGIERSLTLSGTHDVTHGNTFLGLTAHVRYELETDESTSIVKMRFNRDYPLSEWELTDFSKTIASARDV